MPVILSRLSHAAGRAVSPCEFTKLYELPACRTVFDDVARYLTSALTGVSNLLNPECIFLGHDAVHFGRLKADRERFEAFRSGGIRSYACRMCRPKRRRRLCIADSQAGSSFAA